MDGSHHSYVPAILSTQKFLFSLFFPWTFHELYYLYDLGQIVIFLTLLLYQLFTVHTV